MKSINRQIVLFNLMLFCCSTAFSQENLATQQLDDLVKKSIATQYSNLENRYKDFHANPELSFNEIRTASKLSAEMRAIGFEVTEKVGKTGVVAIFRNGPGPIVMIRTDMDALPMEEKSGLPYASKIKTTWNERETYVAHSCGHDMHMTIWLGTARTLVELKDHWKGTLMFIAQPAEELGSGAKAMLDDGLFTRFPKPDYALALHTNPGLADTVFYSHGPVTSAANNLEVTFFGRGSHGSTPDKSIDPIITASRFIMDLQSVVSREKDPFEFGVVTVGSIHGGTSGNIIPDSVTLRGTIRSYSPEVRNKLLSGVRRMALAAAMASGAPEPEIKLDGGGYAVVNDDALTMKTEQVLQRSFGNDKVKKIRPLPTSEDFSEYGAAGVPSFFFLVGVNSEQDINESMRAGGKPIPFNHSPYFAPVLQPTISTGVQAMSLTVLNLLNKKE